MSGARVHPARRARGFTLIEVLIALAVLALALAAVISTAGGSTREAANLRDKTFAHWVAMNRVTEARLAVKWPDTGTSEGDSEMVGRRWHWRMTVAETAAPDLRRLTVDVFPSQDDDTSLTSLTAFVARPVPPGGSTGAPAGSSPAAGGNSQSPNDHSSGAPP